MRFVEQQGIWVPTPMVRQQYMIYTLSLHALKSWSLMHSAQHQADDSKSIQMQRALPLFVFPILSSCNT